MRFGWLAAAAAMVLGAGQAQAARYIEFKIVGIATTNNVYDADGKGYRPYTITDSLSFTVDTQKTGTTIAPYSLYTVGGHAYNLAGVRQDYTVFGIELSFNSTSPVTYISTNNGLRAGPAFRTAFSLSDITSELQPVPTADIDFTYGYVVDPRSPTIYTTAFGKVVNFTAKVTDVAPASFDLNEAFSVAAVPEPASWAMMIVGFGAAGGMMRRGRGSRRRMAAVA